LFEGEIHVRRNKRYRRNHELEAKPTITIAEKQGDRTQTSDAQPTITIAEKDGGQ
jgi:hypothetical protein